MCPEYGEAWNYCEGGDEDLYTEHCAYVLEYFAGEDCYLLVVDVYACLVALDCEDWPAFEVDCAVPIAAAAGCDIP